MSAPKSSKVLYISPAYEKVWQHPRQDLYENPRLWMDSIHPEDVGIVRANWVRQIQGEYTYEEFRIVRPNGTIRWIANHAYPIISNDGHVHRITGIAQDITDRKQAQAQLQTALAEKETLLLELYHRTKNNMQVICAILDLQTAYIDDERVLQVFAETTNRIQSMALVHQKLYQSQDLSRIDLREYITELAEFLLASYQVSPTRIKLALDLETVFVLIDTAIPCGLILNELISNALKYAFPGDRKGEIRIQLLKTASDEIELQVADNGVGGAPGFDFREDGRFGLKTIFSLGEQQLQGHVRFEVNNGVVCRLEFKDNLYKPRV